MKSMILRQMLLYMVFSFQKGLRDRLNHFAYAAPAITMGMRCRPNCPVNFSKCPASVVPHCGQWPCASSV